MPVRAWKPSMTAAAFAKGSATSWANRRLSCLQKDQGRVDGSHETADGRVHFALFP